MKTIAFIPCTKAKNKLSQKQPIKAKDLYTGTMFKKAYKIAQLMNVDMIFILSAEHGLISPDMELTYYDKYLGGMTERERIQWCNKVKDKLDELHIRQVIDLKNDKFIFLTGKDYYRGLLNMFNNYEIIGERLSLGKKLQEFTRIIKSYDNL